MQKAVETHWQAFIYFLTELILPIPAATAQATVMVRGGFHREVMGEGIKAKAMPVPRLFNYALSRAGV